LGNTWNFLIKNIAMFNKKKSLQNYVKKIKKIAMLALKQTHTCYGVGV
jgi:hypothetical protein